MREPRARQPFLQDERGSILFMTVLGMLLLTTLALSLAMTSTLEGRIALNHYAVVKALHVADAGVEGVKQELLAYVNDAGHGPWLGTWNQVLAAKGALCGLNSVVFDFTPTGAAAWTRIGARPTLFVRDNDTDPWEDGNPCTDVDGVITIRADGRLLASPSGFGALRPIAVDAGWRAGGDAAGWDNAVQGGGNPNGAVISGNAMIYGGVALGDIAGGVAWAMGGTSGIRNNYQNGVDAPASEQLRASTRALVNPTLLALGDVSLSASFLVPEGTVTFSGGATAGLAQGSTTGRKQTLMFAMARDFDPGAVTAIHADRTGLLTDPSSRLPLLSDVVGGGETRTWERMLVQDGLHITPIQILFACKPETPGAAECRPDVIDGFTGKRVPGTTDKRRFCVYQNMPAPDPLCDAGPPNPGGIPSKFDLLVDEAPNPNSATLEIQGIIVFDNYGTGQGIRLGGLKGGGPESLGEIVYRGQGVIFVDDEQPNNCTGATPCAGRLTVAADIKTLPGQYPTAVNPPVYPPVAGTVNTIGFMADRVGIGYGADGASTPGVGDSPTHTALFYAQSELHACKSTEIFGSLMSSVVNLDCQVPKIAAVRTMSQFLPFGMIGSVNANVPGTLAVIRWREGTR